MTPRKRTKKSIAWYRRELRHIAQIADAGLNRKTTASGLLTVQEGYGVALAAISACASEAAEAYLER